MKMNLKNIINYIELYKEFLVKHFKIFFLERLFRYNNYLNKLSRYLSYI